MPSKRSEVLKDHYRNLVATMDPDMSLAEWRDISEHLGDVTAEPGGVDYIETDAGGVPVMWAVPKGCAEHRVVLGLHGSGFISGSMYTHRKLFGHLAKAMDTRALILDYRRAPEHVHPVQVEGTVAAYGWLLDQGIDTNHIALAGDSAGAGLAITALVSAHEQGLPMPAASMPLSPWVDMELTAESMEYNRENDVLLQRELVEELVSMFLGKGGNPKDPLANPLYADLTGLPPVYIQVGGDEILLDESRRLAERARKADVDVRLDIFPEQQHTFHLAAGRTPEADEAMRRLANWVRPKLGLAPTARTAAPV